MYQEKTQVVARERCRNVKTVSKYLVVPICIELEKSLWVKGEAAN
jgi:hypothetical protein